MHPIDKDVFVLRDVMVPMRDGVRLATDIALPARGGQPLPGPFPTLVHRTPYDKTAARPSEISARDPEPRANGAIAAEMARAGYAVIMQDCRGRYASEGRFRKYIGEGADGLDTLDWARAQSWCDGRFGTFGLSYSAHVQTALAAYAPDGLCAMFLDSGGFWNAYQGGIRRGGAFELKQATWAFKHARLSRAAARDPVVKTALEAERIEDWLTVMPWKRGHSPLRHAPDYEDYFFEQWEHADFDDFWRQPELCAIDHYDALARAPVFLICGWYDPYSETMIEHFKEIRARAGRAELVMGPWLHGRRSQRWAGQVDFGQNALLDGQIAPDYATLRLAWFDRWMKPGPTAAAAPAPARWFRMGGGSGRKLDCGRLDHGGAWRAADAFPPPGAADRPFHLGPAGDLTDAAPAPGTLALRTDPDDPVPTLGGQITSGEPVMLGGAFDQTPSADTFGARAPYLPLAARADILVFATAPLAEDLEIAGPVSLHLRVETDAPDIDLTAKLIDWAPASTDWPMGFAMNVTDGILRLRYRDGWTRPKPMRAGVPADIRIDLPPTANLFKAGHRVRLDIAGSNFPRFDVNPQTGEPVGKARLKRIAITHFHLGGDAGARLVLTVPPA